MNKFTYLLVFLFFTLHIAAQEFNALVIVNAEQTGESNQQIFKTLERDLTEFINETSWTNKVYANQERIDASFNIIVSEYDSDMFTASIQIQASRPVFGSTYLSPIYNYNDRQFSFNYREFQPLNFNLNTFESNLISVVAFHVYTILGLDASTFSENGGEEYHSVAKQIVNTAASGNFSGWKASDGNQSRYQLNEALVSPIFSTFHNVMYKYHRKGLDIMQENPREGKEVIAEAINELKDINDRRPNSFLLRTFFDTKAEEIQSIFSDGPSVTIDQLTQNLTRMAPTKRENWSKIKY
ncbi:type IX secretion system protein PorD [Planktosalinus lacus]|uniref:DUF4835 domain-containing protein n=1 Tax=Planktosalinus lacus TaxID=1526573 RepID=A0A8J2V9W4_9FLAO|nr:DUF4835 family protein [Planktosalinus lacus]GGD91493.1 DUF4835 domain-containing protein [Planktosalinus lacus]